jgi:hypothetical protein
MDRLANALLKPSNHTFVASYITKAYENDGYFVLICFKPFTNIVLPLPDNHYGIWCFESGVYIQGFGQTL